MGLLSMLGLARASEVSTLTSRIDALQNDLIRRRLGDAHVAVAGSLSEMRREIASGVPITFGRYEYELNRKLRGPERWDVLDQMESDAHVKGALRINTLPLLTAEWSIEPASDDERDNEIAEFVSSNLLRQGGDRYGQDYWCSSSWRAQRLPEELDMLRAGYSMFAKTVRIVNGKRVYDRIQWLEPESVDPHGWQLSDSDELMAVKRTYRRPSGRFEMRDPIDSSRLALYVWEFRGARFEGRPLIRSMYGPWSRKDFTERMAMILMQRVGAPVPYGIMPNQWDATTVARFQEFIESLRGTAPDLAFGVFSKNSEGDGPEVKFAGSEINEIDRARKFIDGENAEIAHAGGTKMALLGETQTGSRALGESMSRMEMLMVQAVGDIICEWETHGVANLPGLIEELVTWNFAGVKKFPRLVVQKISPEEGLENIDAFLNGAKAGLVPTKDPEMRKQFVERFGYNLPDEAYQVQEPDIPVNGQTLNDQGTIEEGDQSQSRRASLSIDDFRRRIAPLLVSEDGPVSPGNFRRRTLLEAKYVNLAAISESYRTGERDALAVLRTIRREMIADVLSRVRSGKITVRSLESQARSRFRRQKQSVALFKRELAETGREGISHVRDELIAMRSKRISLALMDRKITVFEDRVEVVAVLDVEALWKRILGEGLAEFSRLERQRLDPEEIMRQITGYLEGLSDKPEIDLARKSSVVAYNQGRAVEIEMAEARAEADYVVRSEILDDNTCPPCRTLDGSVMEIGTDEYYELMPPARCDGGERCRGFYVPLARGLAA